MEQDLEKQARRAAGMKMGWIIHVTVFTLVNAGLWLAGKGGTGWFGLPTGGWIIGLLVHGAVVWMSPIGQSLYDKLLQRERDRLTKR